ncbi:hypothetical protein Tco_1080663 [Tanacetum coccineum]|uniref:Uncharacterized protein n=1 Tax=Tanacetum coccineum TaxID=301880 RepID=A0ABQ5HVE7_9ASTR
MHTATMGGRADLEFTREVHERKGFNGFYFNRVFDLFPTSRHILFYDLEWGGWFTVQNWLLEAVVPLRIHSRRINMLDNPDHLLNKERVELPREAGNHQHPKWRPIRRLVGAVLVSQEGALVFCPPSCIGFNTTTTEGRGRIGLLHEILKDCENLEGNDDLAINFEELGAGSRKLGSYCLRAMCSRTISLSSQATSDDTAWSGTNLIAKISSRFSVEVENNCMNHGYNLVSKILQYIDIGVLFHLADILCSCFPLDDSNEELQPYIIVASNSHLVRTALIVISFCIWLITLITLHASVSKLGALSLSHNLAGIRRASSETPSSWCYGANEHIFGVPAAISLYRGSS